MDGGKLFLVIALGVLVFEVVEHVIFPLVWSWSMRRRSPLIGMESMLEKHAQVLRWNRTTGIVRLEGEEWKAKSSKVLAPGDVVRITQVDSLTLTVVPVAQENDTCPKL
ncbi:NfeD family protein [Desulfosoma caldarium]|uniref:NfeD family protein n=1 Tax=Desulfosoma caldarium TaxID=610254 RepID=UPI000F47354D|nr:NfeD family protein [Desulfosoma caldarium]